MAYKNRFAINRRNFMKASLGLLATGSTLPRILQSGELCDNTTPKQTEGPFYPVGYHSDTDWDLIRINGRRNRAKGETILVEGIVRDHACRRVRNATVEIWQACQSGRYNHPNDESENSLDPNFQGWGVTTTDINGYYFFQTVVPGHYNVSDTWTRPPHIHFKVYKTGFQELTTQLYFEGHPLNRHDHILQRVDSNERGRVIQPLLSINESLALPSKIAGSLAARRRIVFDIVI